MTEKQRKAFEKLGIKADEIAEIEATDKEIDRGAKLFELPDDLKAGAKKARQADRKPAERKPREKKQDADKQALIEQMVCALEVSPTNVRDVEIINIEREFSFMYNGRKYKVVMSCPRS